MKRLGKDLQAGQAELRLTGAAVDRFMDDLQTVAAAIEALGYIVYDNPDAAENILREGREALAGLVGLARAGICRSSDRPEPEAQEDESVTGRRRRPFYGRPVGESGGAGV